ncbi:MAG: hypothetical protein F6J98_11925 [Moorea sp. SIO4G2]|nr:MULTISPECIES: hypothetical protein [unclassified Moorena]NEO11286.1 hypothetical protein [Moorena sp. SIO3E8]NEO61112.1 hypothetical protein [Moorena sp. SIO4G2]NEP98800.1 hypothetical protein [Moorena sp. SIO3F7]
MFRGNYRTNGREITSSDRKRQKATGKRQEGQEIGSLIVQSKKTIQVYI